VENSATEEWLEFGSSPAAVALRGSCEKVYCHGVG
jgi:hypothetical protein